MRSRRRDIASRVCAALLGGYVVASVLSMLVARVLPFAAPTATAVALLVAPLLYLAAILWVFAVKSLARGWLGIGVVTVLSGMLVWESIRMGGRL